MKKYFNEMEMEYKQHYLFPSTIHCSKEPCLVTTILGSCVSVCMFDAVNRIGGVNHYMLPLWNGDGLATPKYGNIAIKKLLDAMIANGANKSNIITKVFGGGEVIDTNVANFHIGERNIAIAKSLLEDEHIPIKAISVGGKLGRKIIFDTFTGTVQHKFIEKTQM
jgi:chemotaxis protein CheD